MAIVTTGPSISEIRGTVGNTTYSRVPGSMVARAKLVRVAGWNAQQVIARNSAKALGLRWNANLTETQREAWRAAASQTNHRNRFAQRINLTGQQHYMSVNRKTYYLAGYYRDDPPPPATTPDCPNLIVITATAAPAHLILDFSRHPTGYEDFYLRSTQCLNVGVKSFGHRWCYVVGFQAGTPFPYDTVAFFNTTRGTIVAGKKIGFLLEVVDLISNMHSGQRIFECLVT